MASIISVDLGGTNIAGAAVNEQGEILARAHRKTVANEGANGVIDRIVAVIDELKASRSDVIGAVIGSPGVVDPVHGVCRSQAFNIPGWEGLHLADLISDRVHLPVKVDNDANLAGLGEYWKGAGQNEPLMLIVTLGTGIGGGIVMHGEIFYGATNRGVEFGIISVDANSDRELAGCRGAVETFASASAIAREARKLLPTHPDSKILELAGGDIDAVEARHVCDADRAGDALAAKILDEAMKYLATAIGTLINVLNPTAVILAGGLAKAGTLILDRINRELDSGRAFAPIRKHCTVKLAKLGDDAGILGGAKLGLDSFSKYSENPSTRPVEV